MPAPSFHDFVPAWVSRSAEKSAPEPQESDSNAVYMKYVIDRDRLAKAVSASDAVAVNAAFVELGSQGQDVGLVFLETWVNDPEKAWLVQHLVTTPPPNVDLDAIVTSWKVSHKWGILEKLLIETLPYAPEQSKAWLAQVGPAQLPRVEGLHTAHTRVQATAEPETATKPRRRRRS